MSFSTVGPSNPGLPNRGPTAEKAANWRGTQATLTTDSKTAEKITLPLTPPNIPKIKKCINLLVDYFCVRVTKICENSTFKISG